MTDPKIIELPKISDPRGNLSFFENLKQIPFEIKRTFWIYDVPGGESRGKHAYYSTDEFIVAISGSFDVMVDDGQGNRQTFHMNRSYYGLYVPPQATPVKHLQVRPENGWRRAIVTLKSGGSDPRRYVFDYALGDWSMTRSSGVEERKEREVADGRAAYIKNETIAAKNLFLSWGKGFKHI